MSSVPTKQIDGDVAVGRNVSIGGKATVRGSATIGHNLKVEGWLDAPNVKGPNKGLFKTGSQLREAYPTPHEGWWALVGNTLPAQVYMADGGAWVAQTNADGTPKLAGNPTVDSSEYMDAVEQVTGDLKAVKEEVDQNKEDIRSLRSGQTTQGNQINLLQTAVQTAQGRADKGVADAATAQSGVNTINNSKGKANGFAPLDANAKVPAANLPGYVDDVVEFNAMVEDVTVQDNPTALTSTATGCMVVYDKTAGRFLLAVAITPPSGGTEWVDITRPLHSLKGDSNDFSHSDEDVLASDLLGPGYGDYWEENDGIIGLIKNQFKYYADWGDKVRFGDSTDTGIKPEAGKVYISTSDNRTFRWSGSSLVAIGSDLALGRTASTAFPGDAGATLEQKMDDAIAAINDKLEELGEGVGNCYNVTAARLANGESLPTNPPTYDTKQSAIDYAISKGAVGIGVQITYAGSANGWRTFQYIGLSDDPTIYENYDNWIDVAGQSAGKEPMYNINELCMELTGMNEYTLSTAVTALERLGESKGLDYFKAGMVITYCTNAKEKEWKAMQLLDKASRNNYDYAWKEFGGSGTELVAHDTPTNGGTDAFSTGGAYDRLIVDFEESFSEEGNSKIYQPVNAARKAIGSPIAVPLGGGGQQDAITFAVRFESQTIYGTAGGKIIGRFAARSVTKIGNEEVVNNITEITIKDTNGLVLRTDLLINERSSVTLQDWKFKVDFTDWFEGAGQRAFIVTVKDQDGNVRSVDVSVNAVDVTVEIVKDLNECRVTSGAGATTLTNFYIFPRNTLGGIGGGIDAIVEILWNGEWHELGRANIQKTFSQDIVVNPSNVLGGNEKMEHGSYLLRIHGYAPNAKVTGNYVYTSVMCVDSTKGNTPIVAIRYDAKTYDDELQGTVALYDTANLQIAAYTQASVSGNTEVTVKANGESIQTFNAASSAYYLVNYQIQGYSNGDIMEFKAEGIWKEANGTIHRSESPAIQITVEGSAIDVELKTGSAFCYDFAMRTNADVDKSISDNGVTMAVDGANWRTNGFVKYLGENALRIAENMTVEIPFRPFSQPTVETAGAAVQLAFATNNIKDKDALLFHSYNPAIGAGFYVKGNVAGIYCAKGVKRQRQERKFRCGEKITMAVVVEPASRAYERGNERYSTIKMYLNGEEVACLGYIPGQNAISQNVALSGDGHDGDFYLYYLLPYNSYYDWAQAFSNYLAKETNVTAMMKEFESEDVLDNLNRPSLDKLKAKGMPYYVIVAPQSVFDEFDGDVNTSTEFACTLYYFNPPHPEVNFKATNVFWRRQGTTSAKRPIKNDRFNLNKKHKKAGEIGKVATVELLNPNEATLLGRKAILAAKHNKVYVSETGLFVDTVTVKVDYSDSSNANDCGVCDMMNATFRALGGNYITPAQRAFDGHQILGGGDELTGLEMNHSTRNHPIAVFRSTNEQMSDAWFHSKGNWKEDKGEQVALGFKDTPGYNLGCLNYGDFVEYFGNKGETLAQTEARFKADSSTDPSAVYVISQYCGRDYLIMRHNGTVWQRSAGSMQQVGGKWIVSGDVVNPVTGFELLSYQDFCWWKGVSSVEEMMKPEASTSSWVQKLVQSGAVSATTYPKWTQYFECMIDDDQLQIDLANGRKVPYELYRMLRFCHDCDMVVPVANKDNRWQISEDATKIALWKNDLWQYASPQSLYAYTLFTDYLAATDQRAKNMQPMWFLEDGYSVTNGEYSSEESVRMYLNKVYDCDTCNGKDNDGGCTVDPEADPNIMTNDEYKNPYAGYGSILFTNVALVPNVYLDGTHTADNQLSLTTVAAAMRSAKTNVDGVDIEPFSPDGAQYFFVEKRLKFWKKLISSYDGERKYIESVSNSDDVYFYALQGLGLTALPQFIEQRWRIRDGYYQTGRFFSGVLSGRTSCASNNARIRIKAAKTGYFGVGHDASGQLDEAVFLEAGQEHYFTKFSHTEYALMYIYQADRLAEIDLSEISLDSSFNFQVMTLAEKITLGSDTHQDVSIASAAPISSLPLGSLPFLKELDVRNTTIASIDASKCPRLEKVLASGTPLQTCEVAETSPVSVLELPETMTELSLVNLPNLPYPGGLTIEGLSNVTKLMISGCPNIDAMAMIESIVNQAGELKSIGLRDVNVTASIELLRSLKARRIFGLDENGNDISADKSAEGEGKRCSGMTGRWIMSELVENTDIAELAAYFPALELHNSQFSYVVYDDVENDPENISNVIDQTGHAYNNAYTPPAHTARLESMSHGVKGTFSALSNKMICERLDDDDYNKLESQEAIDLTDSSGMGYDIYKHIPNHWYKGVNDFKNNKKLSFRSICIDEPLTTVNKIIRLGVADTIIAEYSALMFANNPIGGEPVFSETADTHVGSVSVDGMKQVRWPGVNNEFYGAMFLDADGKVMSEFRMSVFTSDFIAGHDYLFCDVPAGAKTFIFTAPADAGQYGQEVIAVDSSHVEAIEPDWVFRKEFLVGIYGMVRDNSGRARSLSGIKTAVGGGSSEAKWTYDAEGRCTNLSVPEKVFCSYIDCINLCEIRGAGFHAISYEQSKDLANIIMELTGTRDIQALCGRGGGSYGYVTGAQKISSVNINSYGNKTVANPRNDYGNVMFGIQNFVGFSYEWMSDVAVNVSTFKEWKALHYPSINMNAYDFVWKIYDIQTDTERAVQGINKTGACIARVRHGRFMDIIASKLTSDSSKYNENYADRFTYSHGWCMVVARSDEGTSIQGGLVSLNATRYSSSSATTYGTRLAFSGEIVFDD